MGDQTNIEWCDRTFNPFIGCTKVSPGCDNCYAEKLMDHRMHKVVWGAGQARVRTSAANWNKPLAWNRAHAAFFAEHGRRQRVFCASLADVFDNAVDPAWRRDLFSLIELTPNLDWLLLTKRIGNVLPMMSQVGTMLHWVGRREDYMPPNVWLGATIVNQDEADRDIPKLMRVPAARRFLSMEPLLGPVDLTATPAGDIMCRCAGCMEMTPHSRLDWVIVGGESGPGARPMHPEWARGLRDQCTDAGVPYLFKQWGEWVPRGPRSWGYPIVEGVPRVRLTDAGHNGQDLGADGGKDVWMNRAGKKLAGRLLDGVQHDGYPGAR